MNTRFRKRTKSKYFALKFRFTFPVCFLGCWFPFFVCNTWSGIALNINRPDLEPPMMAFLLTTWLGYINSLLNPIIYTIYNREFRKAFTKIFKAMASKI